MKIAFIGYGSMATALAGQWADQHDLFFGGHSPDKAALVAQRFGAGSGDAAAAAAAGEVVVLATPNTAVFDAIDSAGGDKAFAGRTVLDITNPYDFATQIHKTYDGGSLAEAIARRIPSARVVKAFNMCQAKVWEMRPPMFDGRRLVTLLCGDEQDAKATVARLIEAVGAEPLDIGSLAYARNLEAAAALVIKLLMSGRDPHTVLNLIQPERKPIA